MDELFVKLKYDIKLLTTEGGTLWMTWSGAVPEDFVIMCGYASKDGDGWRWNKPFTDRYVEDTRTVYNEFLLNLIAYERIYA